MTEQYVNVLVGVDWKGMQTSLPFLADLIATTGTSKWFSEWMPVVDWQQQLDEREQIIAEGYPEWLFHDRLTVVGDMVYCLKEYDMEFRTDPEVHALFEKHGLLTADTNQLIEVPSHPDLGIGVPDFGNEYVTRKTQYWSYPENAVSNPGCPDSQNNI